MNNEQVLSEIGELKRDKVLYTLESIAVSLLALLLFIGAPSVFPEIINPYLPSSLKIMQAIILIPSTVWILVMVVNTVKYIKILKLKKMLSKSTSKAVVASKKTSSKRK